MNDNPLVFVCLLTYRRTDYAIRAIEGIHKFLNYDNLAWYVADAGSAPEHVEIINRTIGHEPYGHSAPLPPSENWNRAISWIMKRTPFYLRLEDDMVLNQRLDLLKYVEVLNQRTEVGIIRFGLMPINLEMESVGFNGRIYMNIYKNRQYCYSGHPHLAHQRFHEIYGMFPPADTPGGCELAMDGRVRATHDGPQVWWPLEAGTWGMFDHIGVEKA